MAETLRIDADIPAGNIVVQRIDGNDIYLRPDLRDTEGHWFYWHCRVRGGGGRSLRFHLTSEHTLTSAGPAVSYDRGRTWTWVGADSMDEWSFVLDAPAGADDVRLSMAMPYEQTNLDTFCAAHDAVEVSQLCLSRKGRVVPRLRAGNLSGDAPHRVLLTARHHCCEMMASYALEGILDAATADDALGRWVADNVEILAIPFVDTDGVIDGDQGKNRRPRDHNRDYAGEPVHPEAAAIRDTIPAWSQGRLHVALDLHCPWIRGVETNERIYIVGSRDPHVWAQQQRFGEMLPGLCRGPLPYRSEDNLPFGAAWNTGTNEDGGCSCSRWAADLPGIWLAASFELPYAVARETPVNQASARAFGRDLAAALQCYLQHPPTETP